MMEFERFDKIYPVWMQKLKAELPDFLLYHNADHTKNVVNACGYLAAREGLSKAETELLLTAALFHDCGFLERYHDNEDEGAAIARKVLPEYGYREDEIETIAAIIVSTNPSKEPIGIAEKIIHDADLNYLGRPDYFVRSNQLRRELESLGDTYTDQAWMELQNDFLRSFNYLTPAAVDLVQEGLEANRTWVQNTMKDWQKG